jgi:hypothetical protein
MVSNFASEVLMGIPMLLSNLRAMLLKKVEVSASEGNVAGVTRWSGALERCQALEEEARNLEERAREFKDSLEPSIEQPPQAAATNGSAKINAGSRTATAKSRGAAARSAWVDKLSAKGVVLTGHGKRYQTGTGKRVAIAFASELSYRPNKWFLGLKDEPIDIAVLLCQDTGKRLYEVVLPVSDLGISWSMLSRSAVGTQLKFNVRKDTHEWLLEIPGSNPVTVTKYMGGYGPLR